ncbi:MAG TPA: hypothetical protein PKI14_19325 [Fervidobacterium sp.]|nr:hypothetical protein [Fervidobacterium sp.]
MLQQLLGKFDEWGMEKDGVYYILPQVWKKLDLPDVDTPTTKVVRYKSKPTRMYVLSEQPAPEATEQPAPEATELTPTISYHEFKQNQAAQQKVQDFIAKISEIPELAYIARVADEQRKQYFLYIYLNNTRLSFEELFALYRKGVPKVYATEEDVLCEMWLDLVSTRGDGE